MSIEQQGNALTFLAFFVEEKLGKMGLTVTVDVYRNGTEIVTAANATEVGDGLYSYALASGSVNAEGLYAAVFKTATDTVDQQHIPSLWVVGKGGIENLDAAVSTRTSGSLANLDEAVSTRATPAQVASAVAAVSGGGGSEEYVHTSTVSGDPQDGVGVWVTTGNDPTDNIVASGITNTFGTVTFLLDPGTYYVWEQLAGVNFNNPTEVTIS